MKAPKFRDFISEKVQRSEIQVAILTKVDADSKNVVSKMIEAECQRRNIPCFIINTSEAWVSKNDLEKARELNQKLMPFHKALFFETSPSPVKYVLSKMKLIDYDIRLPLVKIREETQEIIDKLLSETELF